jgi:hypothetical protein
MNLPRFQYSLRTLLLVVTAICLGLGWQVHRVQQRNEVLHWMGKHGYRTEVSKDGSIELALDKRDWTVVIRDSDVPWYWRIFGDHFVELVWYSVDATPEDVDRVKVTFPEAEVTAYPAGFPFLQ